MSDREEEVDAEDKPEEHPVEETKQEHQGGTPEMATEFTSKENEDDGDEQETASPSSPSQKRAKKSKDDDGADSIFKEPEVVDSKFEEDLEYVKNTDATSRLEITLEEILRRKDSHIARLTGEINKLKAFISKRKQTYKRKRKDEGAPTRALSAYNIFVQDRFARLAKENDVALKSLDSDAQLKRVPPANLVAATGNQWKELSAEGKKSYEERAKQDRKRYEEQMAQYQPPDKQANRKRNKTGYNMFFSAHVLRLKQSEMGVPSERGSVARLVGTAWKSLNAEEKQYYEREADKHNGMNPVEKEVDEEEDEDKQRQQQQQVSDPYGHMHPDHQMQMHGGAMPPPMHAGMHQPPQHDPRHHGYAYPPHHMYQPHGYYDYSQHPHAQQPRHHSSSRAPQGYSQYPPPPQGHPYDQRPM
jgi:hypothetical protein